MLAFCAVTVNTAWLTVKLSTDEVLPAKFVSAGYTAVRLAAPTGKEVNVSVATPDAFSVPVPREVAPFLKVTVSPLVVRLPSENGVNVAVSVTDWP